MVTKGERVFTKRRANYWRKATREQTDLQTLAKRYLRACKRHGLTVSEAANVLRMVALDWEGR